MKKTLYIPLVILFLLIRGLSPTLAAPAPALRPAASAPTVAPTIIKSPDGKLSFQLVPGEKDLSFTILYGALPLVSPSPLRFSLDGSSLTAAARISGIKRYQVREKYPWLGAHDTALPASASIWYHDLNGHYEGVHVKKELAAVNEGEWLAPPATLKLQQGLYIAVTEAALQEYSGMALQADGKNGLVLKMAEHQPASHPLPIYHPIKISHTL